MHCLNNTFISEEDPEYIQGSVYFKISIKLCSFAKRVLYFKEELEKEFWLSTLKEMSG